MVILALVILYFLYLALLVSYNWWVGNGGWCNLIIPIIILAIAPQDHILGTDEINVQVSKLKLYLNILYKQEREQIFSNIQGPLVQQKAETLYLWKGKNKNYPNAMFEE